MMFSLTACGNDGADDKNGAEAGLEAGTYEVVKEGYGGDIKMEVTLGDLEIEKIEVLESAETEHIGGEAINNLIPTIIDEQNLNVDAVAGATISSTALLEGVREVVKSHGDLDAFMKEAQEDDTAGKDIEKTVDVVVVGGGAAGLSAAVEASKAGANTLLVEKMPKLGGNTSISSGNIYGQGSEVQEELGMTDYSTVEELIDFYMEKADGRANKDLISYVQERSGQTIDWISKEIGVDLKKREEAGATDNSLIAVNSGVDITNKLAERAESQGTEIMLDTAAEKLLIEDGKVVGIEAKNGNNTVTIHANSVVLATGGFDGSDEAKEKYAPGSVGHHSNSSPGNVGDAIEMVKEVNGQILLKNGMSGIHLVGDQPLNSEVSPLRIINKGIAVTDLGYRYANESRNNPFDYYPDMVETGRKQFYNIADSSVDTELLEKAVELGVAFKADTVEELAQKADIPEYPLQVTVEEYNQAVKNGVDKEFGKDKEDLVALEKAPFYAVKITPNTNGSFGGLVTDLNTRVLTEEGEPIENLYAAGAVANAEYFYLKYPVSGSSIQMCLTLGRVAGEEAANNVNE